MTEHGISRGSNFDSARELVALEPLKHVLSGTADTAKASTRRLHSYPCSHFKVSIQFNQSGQRPIQRSCITATIWITSPRPAEAAAGANIGDVTAGRVETY